MLNIRRSLASGATSPLNGGFVALIWGALLLGLALSLTGCGDDDANPLSSAERDLIGTWGLDLGAVDDDDLAITYTFDADHRASHRLGGAFLRRLRDSELLQEADLGELTAIDQIDGAFVAWDGTWAIQGDSLTVLFDQIAVAVFGDLPIIGRLSVPVHAQALEGEQRAEVVYAYQISDEQLTLRGEAASAGVATQAADEQTAQLDPLSRAALEAVTEALAEAYQQSDATEFVYRKK